GRPGARRAGEVRGAQRGAQQRRRDRSLPVAARACASTVSAAQASGSRLLAAVVLSACVGVIGGGLGAWGVYTHFGPVQRVVTETKTGGGAISVGDIAATVQPSLVTISTTPVTPAQLATGQAT